MNETDTLSQEDREVLQALRKRRYLKNLLWRALTGLVCFGAFCALTADQMLGERVPIWVSVTEIVVCGVLYATSPQRRFGRIPWVLALAFFTHCAFHDAVLYFMVLMPMGLTLFASELLFPYPASLKRSPGKA
ncbi:hypothetical protein AMJ57_02780 [Parcubacteria bacterium SG8_24]|nr:MAG: hypothetical protein AMJ57_02780 [Parcubacteria bacterium SG8_24]